MKNVHCVQTLPSFDELVTMAENEPEQFEQFKRNMCEQAITYSSAEMQPRLRAQQSHLDRVIRQCKNPHHTNIVLANELHNQMLKFKDLFDGKTDFMTDAKIIPFPNQH